MYLKGIVKFTTIILQAADINKDGYVNNEDSLMLSDKLKGRYDYEEDYILA